MRERPPEGGPQLRGGADSLGVSTEGLGQLHEVRVDEGGVRGPMELRHLLPADEAVLRVLPDELDDRKAVLRCGRQLLDVHEEPAVALEADHPTVPVDDLRPNGSWQGDCHRAESVGDDAGVGIIRRVVAGNPHLVGPDVTDEDVVVVELEAQVVEDALRLHREPLVVRHASGELNRERLAHLSVGGDVLAVLVRELLVELPQALADVTDTFDGRTVVPIDLGRAEVDVQDALVSARVPA